MVFGAALLLLINLAYVQLLIRPDGGCDFAERLTSQQLTSFKNPHWPATYAPGTTCRWTFDCPIWYACRLRCLDVGLPQTDDCYMDKLLVSGSGNPQLEGAQVFCGRTEINFRSVGSRLTLALVTNRLSPGGRFRCTIRSEPWTQPWFMSPYSPNPMFINRNEISPEEGEVLHKQKNIISARTNHRRLHSDLPHTGLIQSRKSYTEQEPERTPDIKNVKPEPLYENHVKANSSYAKHLKADSLKEKPVNAKLFSGNIKGDFSYPDNIQAGSPYLDNVEDGSPRLQNPESRIPHVRHVLVGSPPTDLHQSQHRAPHTDNFEAKISHVRHLKAESQYAKSSKPYKKSELPYLDNVEDAILHTETAQEKSPHVKHLQAESPPTDNFDPHIKIDSPYLDNAEDEVPYTNDVEAKAIHVRRAKSASAHYKSFKPRRKLDSEYVESLEEWVSHNKVKQVKSPNVKQVNAVSPHPESFQGRRIFHHVLDVPPHIQKLKSKTPRLKRVKSGLPYADNLDPDNKIDLPYLDNIQEGIEIIQAERTKPAKAGLPYDRRTSPEQPRRKHKVVSHVKRSHEGKHRGLKHVQKASRHVKHEIKRTPSKAKHLPAGLPRITHQQSGLPQTRRVRTHIKRSTKRPPIAPYKGDVSTTDEKQQSYF